MKPSVEPSGECFFQSPIFQGIYITFAAFLVFRAHYGVCDSTFSIGE